LLNRLIEENLRRETKKATCGIPASLFRTLPIKQQKPVEDLNARRVIDGEAFHLPKRVKPMRDNEVPPPVRGKNRAIKFRVNFTHAVNICVATDCWVVQ